MDSEILTLPVKTPPGFPWLEADVAARLGCTTAVLAKIRDGRLGAGIVKGADWTTFKRRICYSTAGVKTAASGLGLMPGELSWLNPTDTPETAPPPPSVPVVTLRVSPRKTQNPYIILALDAEKRLCRVRVKTKDNFRPFMEIKVEHQAGDLYVLVGNCPRFPGKF
jgi:hypothetical protein